MTATQSELRDWSDSVDALMATVEEWCRAAGWDVARQSKRITESELGSYDAAVLVVRAPNGTTVYVEPVARRVAGADGLVDLYAFPSLRRMMLVRQGAEWVLKTDSGVPWPRPWSRETFQDVAPSLAA